MTSRLSAAVTQDVELIKREGSCRTRTHGLNSSTLIHSIGLLPMPLIKQEDGTYILEPRRPGLEAVATTGAVPIDLTGSGESLGFDAPLEYGFGGSLTIAIYSGLMRYLELVPAIRASQMTQREALKEAGLAAWSETKNKAAYCLAIAVVIAILPGTASAFAIAGFVGFGFCTVRLTKQFYSALSNEQRDALKESARKLNVNLNGITDQPEPEAA